MRLSFRYRLYPRPAVEAELLRWLDELRSLYNYALEERRTAWEKEHRSLSYLEQQASLARWRAFDVDGLGSLPYDPARDVLQRIDLAFRAFFRRVKTRGRTGRHGPFPARARHVPWAPRYLSRRRLEATPSYLRAHRRSAPL
jgi:putative transposase